MRRAQIIFQKYCTVVALVAVHITERALRRTNRKTISNLIGRRNKKSTTLTFSYFDRLQTYIIGSSFKAHCRTECPISIKNSIRYCYNIVLHYYRSARHSTTENFQFGDCEIEIDFRSLPGSRFLSKHITYMGFPYLVEKS